MKSTPQRALVLTDSPMLNGGQLYEILTAFDLSLEAVSVITASGSLTKNTLAQGVFNTIVSLSRASGHHDVVLLGLLLSALRPGGSLRVEEAKGACTLSKTLLLAGFADIDACDATLSGQGDFTACTARKPDWETGASTALPRSSKLKPAAAPPAQQPLKRAVWSLAADDEEEELLDDEELLTEEDLKRPEVPAVGDCEVGASKKACADCTCGRAEAEAAGIKAQLTADMLENPQSACGSCGLGDAFRCASCPYRGLPKFEMGQKIELPSDFLTADA